jgi:ergothioneine biosynthesis protein EgtB
MISISLENYLKKFNEIRRWTLHLCEPLQKEDYVVQPMVDVSPPKWHLGHTTWFFEQFILKKYMSGYTEFHPDFSFVFNSYYESIGERVLRIDRGNMTRPTVDEVVKYRHYVDTAMKEFLDINNNFDDQLFDLLNLGFNHEQQHQELLVTDLKYILGQNPLFPVYTSKKSGNVDDHYLEKLKFLDIDEGEYFIGYNGEDFHFDNEEGLHKVFLHKYQISDRLITNREYMEFINSGGYKDFRYWLQEGFEFINTNKIQSPLYWHLIDDEWYYYSLQGLEKINPDQPVTHISFYEADAFSKWIGMRLPTEFEWEIAARIYSPKVPLDGNFAEKEFFLPQPRKINNLQFFGDVWEWTNSSYLPYPFYKKPDDAVGEYNGKFMINQMILRGGSCATPANHIRHTYRNFFHPDKRWQFTGIRLAQHI